MLVSCVSSPLARNALTSIDNSCSQIFSSQDEERSFSAVQSLEPSVSIQGSCKIYHFGVISAALVVYKQGPTRVLGRLMYDPSTSILRDIEPRSFGARQSDLQRSGFSGYACKEGGKCRRQETRRV